MSLTQLPKNPSEDVIRGHRGDLFWDFSHFGYIKQILLTKDEVTW